MSRQSQLMHAFKGAVIQAAGRSCTFAEAVLHLDSDTLARLRTSYAAQMAQLDPAAPTPGVQSGDYKIVRVDTEHLLVGVTQSHTLAIKFLTFTAWFEHVRSVGSFTDVHGTLRTPDGERCIFDDVDE